MRSKPLKRYKVATAQSENTNRRSIIIAGLVAIGVIALGVLLYLSIRGPSTIDGIRRVVGLSEGHDPDVVYEDADQLPPVGGVHDPTWQNCGIYEEVIETKHVLHSLEHGAVWVTYSLELSADDVADLQGLVRSKPYVVLSPYPGLRSPVVLTAWGIQLEVNSVSDSRIGTFIDRYQQGPQTPELGATCQNGVGSPLGSGS